MLFDKYTEVLTNYNQRARPHLGNFVHTIHFVLQNFLSPLVAPEHNAVQFRHGRPLHKLLILIPRQL